jgi:CheY-like chemotaxis protein
MPCPLILVVEDQSDIREMMRIFLEMEGYAVIEAKDGREAVIKVLDRRPDLVFMDIAMPVVDGVEATKAIREIPEVASVPIVAVSAYGSYFRELAHDAGCDLLLRKPLDLDALRPVIERLIHRSTGDRRHEKRR